MPSNRMIRTASTRGVTASSLDWEGREHAPRVSRLQLPAAGAAGRGPHWVHHGRIAIETAFDVLNDAPPASGSWNQCWK